MARELRLFYLFRLLSTSYLFVPVSVVFALSRGLSLIQVGLLHSVYSAVVILSEVPTGALADRWGRRPAMMAGALSMVAACTLFYYAHGFGVFAGAQALAALSMTLCSGADSAYLFDLLNEHGEGAEYARREGTASAWHQGGNTIAFGAGGLLGALSLALPYAATAVVASVAFFVALLMGKEHRLVLVKESRSASEYLGLIRVSFRTVITRRRLLWVVAYSATIFMLLRATIDIYQLSLASLGFDLRETGLVFAGVYLIAAAVAHRVSSFRKRVSESTLVWVLIGTLVVTFFLLSISTGVLTLVVLAVQAAANGLYSPLVKPLLNREIDDSRRRATVLSVESMVRRLAFGVFSPIAGVLMMHAGPRAGLVLCGVTGILGMVLLAITSKSANNTNVDAGLASQRNATRNATRSATHAA